MPTDGSGVADAAVEPAVQAVAPGGELVIVTIIAPREQLLAATARAGAAGRSARVAAELAERAHEGQRAEAAERLQRTSDRARTAGGRVSRTLIEEGDPGPMIVRLAEALDCDVIVMSTNGRSGWRRAILGSVTDYVAKQSEQVPVLLVRHAASERTAAGGAGDPD